MEQDTQNQPQRKQLEAVRDSARATLAAAEAALAALDSVSAGDELLDLELAAERYPLSTETLRAWIQSRRLKAFIAERRRYVFWRSALDAAIEAAPAVPRLRSVPSSDDGSPLDELDQLLASGALRRGAR